MFFMRISKKRSLFKQIFQKKNIKRDYVLVDEMVEYKNKLNPAKPLTSSELHHIHNLAGEFVLLNMGDTSIPASTEAAYKLLEANKQTSYNEIASKIEVLTASKAAYVAILNNNDLSYEDIITINKEIEDINAELLKLNKEISSIESITDFATIRMTIRQPTPHELEGNLSFLNSYINYLKDVGVFLFEFILYTIPFALIAGIVITIVYVIRKKRNK